MRGTRFEKGRHPLFFRAPFPEKAFFFISRGARKKETVMKKIIIALLAALIVCTALTFTACGKPADGKFPEGASVTLVLATEPESVITVDISGMDKDICLTDILDAEDIGYEMSGTFVNAVDGITLGSGEYLYFYTSVAADYDVSAWATTVEKNGVTLTNSGVGAGEMTIEDGCTIYIGKIVY